MNIEKDFYKFPIASSPDSGLPKLEQEQPIEVGHGPVSGEADELVDYEQWLVEANNFLIDIKQIRRRSEDKKIIDQFIAPYREGRLSLAPFFKNEKTSALALEIIRQVSLPEFENEEEGGKKFATCDKCGLELSPVSNYCSECGSKVETENHVNDPIFHGIVSSLEAIDDQLRSEAPIEENAESGTEKQKRFRNNALYAISEALKVSDPTGRQKIDSWFLKNFQDLSDWCVNYKTKDGKRDVISDYTYKNIIYNTGDKALLRKVLEFSMADINTEHIISQQLLRKNHPSYLRDRKYEIAVVLATKLGLDEKIVDKWSRSRCIIKKDRNGNDITEESYLRNFEAAMRLDFARPGAAKELFENFGIANFDRYDDGMLLRQLEAEDQSAPYGVVAYPEDDYNGAFFSGRKQLGKMGRDMLAGGYETRIVEAASQFDLARRLNGFHKKYNGGGHKIDFLLIGGHGSPESVSLGRDEFEPPPVPKPDISDGQYQTMLELWEKKRSSQKYLRKTLVAEDVKGGRGQGIKRAVQKWFSDGAPVVFISCSTGAEGGIAQTASKELGVTTIGPDKPTNFESIDVNFDERGKPIINVEYFSAKADNDQKQVKAMRYTAKEQKG